MPSPTPSDGSSGGNPSTNDPMDDDDVSWGSGEFSDGESDNEILEESGKEVQSVQVGSLEQVYKQEKGEEEEERGGNPSTNKAMDDDNVSWCSGEFSNAEVTMRL